MKVGDFYGHKCKKLKYRTNKEFPTQDAVGIEIEIEKVNDIYQPKVEGFINYWNTTGDDSLRNQGREYVTVSELWGEDITIALDLMKEFLSLNKEGGYVEVSERCSIHVHVDVRDLLINELRNFLLVATAVEPLLFKVSGNRRGNIYCIPASDFYNGNKHIQMIAESKEDKCNILDTAKYSSMNTSALHKYGSIEFRHHEGTDDVNRIKNWIKCLLNIKEYARGIDEVIADFPFFVSSIGFAEFIQAVFKEQTEQFLYAGFHLDLIEGVRTVQEGMFLREIERVNNKLRKKGEGKLIKNFIETNEDRFIVEGKK